MRLCSVNTTADIDSYILGVLWGILSLTSEGFWLCHKDLWYITVIKEHLDIFANSHISSSDAGSQYRLKITREKDVSKIKDILYAYNWAPRKAAIRPYPHGVEHDRDFIRAWVELHSHADMRNAKKRDGAYFRQRRLRIYGNVFLLGEISLILAASCGQKLRKLQKTTNRVTKALYIQGRNVLPVLSYLYEGVALYNPAAKQRLWETLEI